jgi:hypothetical protein
MSAMVNPQPYAPPALTTPPAHSDRAALDLAERLRDPATRAAVDGLLDRVDRLNRAIDAVTLAAERAPGAVAMAVDIADEMMRDAQASGLDVEKGLAQGAGAAIRFGAMMGPEQVASLEAVLRSGLLDPGAVRVVGGVGRALASATADEPPRVGPLALLRALRDPDVQRSLGLLLRVAAALGRDIAAPVAAVAADGTRRQPRQPHQSPR